MLECFAIQVPQLVTATVGPGASALIALVSGPMLALPTLAWHTLRLHQEDLLGKQQRRSVAVHDLLHAVAKKVVHCPHCTPQCQCEYWSMMPCTQRCHRHWV